jgi:site-specific recombinase XerC
MRRAEGVGLTVDDVGLDQRMVWVLGKGHRPRALPPDRSASRVDGFCIDSGPTHSQPL